MALLDYLSRIVQGTGGGLRRAAEILDRFGPNALRSDPAVKLQPSSNPTMAPAVSGIPGVTPWTPSHRPTPPDVQAAMQTIEAYFGRISYDAGPGPTRYSSYPATDLTPEKIAGAQQEAVAGWPLRWAEMTEQVLGRDSHLSGIGQQRVDDVIKGTWRLVRSHEDHIAECMRSASEEALRGIDDWEDGLGWLLWSNAYAYSSDEITWKREVITFKGHDGRVVGPVELIVPARLDSVHAKHFRFDMRTDEPLLWLGGNDGLSLPMGKFAFMKGEGQMPITARHGYMWPCIWLSHFRSIGWSGWATFVNRFGMPVPLIYYQGTIAQYTEFKAAYQDLLNNLGAGNGAVIPRNGAELEIKDPAQGGRANDPHSALSDACDSAQSVRVLGATLTAKIGNVGSFSASTAHLEVKYAREEADARRMWRALRSQLIVPFVRINAYALAEALADAGYPTNDVDPAALLRRAPSGLHRVPRESSATERFAILRGAVEIGMDVSAEQTHYDLDIPRARGAADRIPGPPQQVTKGGKVVGSVEASSEGAEAPEEPKNEGGAEGRRRQLPPRRGEE